jgi:hypothetical protein
MSNEQLWPSVRRTGGHVTAAEPIPVAAVYPGWSRDQTSASLHRTGEGFAAAVYREPYSYRAFIIIEHSTDHDFVSSPMVCRTEREMVSLTEQELQRRGLLP